MATIFYITGVMPPDEHQEEVDNSVYTNLMADYAINTAAWTACLTDTYPLVDWHRWLKVRSLSVKSSIHYVYTTSYPIHQSFFQSVSAN